MSLLKYLRLVGRPSNSLLKYNSDILSFKYLMNAAILSNSYSSEAVERFKLFSPDGRLNAVPEHADYFTVFGIKKSFALNTAKLSKGRSTTASYNVSNSIYFCFQSNTRRTT